MIPNDLQIKTYFHCRQCIEEMPFDTSPQEWQRIQAGFTLIGLQVWCLRHDCNIVHIDFQNRKHPANTSRKANDADQG